MPDSTTSDPANAERYEHLKFHQVPLEIRLAAIDDILDGRKRQIDVADELGLRRQTVHAWVSRVRNGQPAGLRGRPRTPPLPERTDAEIVDLIAAHLPSFFKLVTPHNTWSWQSVATFVRNRTGKTIYRTYAIRLLQQARRPTPPRSRRTQPPAIAAHTPDIMTSSDLSPFRERISAVQRKVANHKSTPKQKKP